MQTSAYGHFNDIHLHTVPMQSQHVTILHSVSCSDIFDKGYTAMVSKSSHMMRCSVIPK